MRYQARNWAFLFCLFLSACVSIPTPEERGQTAQQLALSKNWQAITLHTQQFDLRAYVSPRQQNASVLTIFIEGDGFAWGTRSQPSTDPTPINPVALKLALKNSEGNATYLARPCQFIQRNCRTQYWTGARFSEAVIAASNQAISQLKERVNAQHIRLVGYSGGGAIAALIAARRQDVRKLITIAGNLDHKYWAGLHHITPLGDSLNPADYWSELQFIEQSHYVGGKDKVMPESVARSYVSRFPNSNKPNIKVIPEYDHHCCWENLSL